LNSDITIPIKNDSPFEFFTISLNLQGPIKLLFKQKSNFNLYESYL
jgi:hypothetical protein